MALTPEEKEAKRKARKKARKQRKRKAKRAERRAEKRDEDNPGRPKPGNPGGTDGGGKRKPVGKVGRHLSSIFTPAQLSRLNSILSSGDFGVKGRLNTPELRRMLSSGKLNASDTSFIESLLGVARSKAPAVSRAADPEGGKFKFGKSLFRNFTEEIPGDSIALSNLLQSVFSGVSTDVLAQYFKGGKVNLPDLRRLLRSGALDGIDPNELSQLYALAGISPSSGGVGGGVPLDPTSPFSPGGGEIPGFGDIGNIGVIGDGGLNDLLDPELLSAILDRLIETINNPGFDPDLLNQMRNRVRADAKVDIRNSTARAEERLAAKGLHLGGGLTEQAILGLESGILDQQNRSLLNIDTANAEAAITALANSFSTALGLGSLEAQHLSLQLQQAVANGQLDLGQLQALLGHDIALQGLDLQEIALLMDASLQELLINLQLGGLPGFPSSSPGPGSAGLVPTGPPAGGGSVPGVARGGPLNPISFTPDPLDDLLDEPKQLTAQAGEVLATQPRKRKITPDVTTITPTRKRLGGSPLAGLFV